MLSFFILIWMPYSCFFHFIYINYNLKNLIIKIYELFTITYLDILAKVWSIKGQLVEALPKIADMASSKKLKDALLKHLEEAKV